MKGMCRPTLCLSAILISAAVTAAQTHADFSGVWKPVESAGSSRPAAPLQPGGPPPPPRTLVTTIAQSATDMKVQRRVETGGREAVYVFVYRLDGTESVNQMGPAVFRTKATWEGPSLVLTSAVSTEGNPIGEVREVYRIENGDLFIETARKTAAGTFTEMSIQRKQ